MKFSIKAEIWHVLCYETYKLGVFFGYPVGNRSFRLGSRCLHLSGWWVGRRDQSAVYFFPWSPAFILSLAPYTYEAFSVSSVFQAATLSLVSFRPRANSSHRAALDGESPHPTSTGNSHACQRLSLHSRIRDSRPSSQGPHHLPLGTAASFHRPSFPQS